MKITVYVKDELGEKAKKAGVKMSDAMTEILQKKLKDKNISYAENPDIIILAKCPFCGTVTQTSSIKLVRCKNNKCQRNYRLIPKNYPSRIYKIPKGKEAVKKMLGVGGII